MKRLSITKTHTKMKKMKYTSAKAAKTDWLVAYSNSRLLLHVMQLPPGAQLLGLLTSNMIYYQFSPVEHLKRVIIALPKL